MRFILAYTFSPLFYIILPNGDFEILIIKLTGCVFVSMSVFIEGYR